MYRKINEKIFFETTEYAKWLELRPKLEEQGYKLHETSTVTFVAEKEYTIPVTEEMLGGKGNE